MAVEIFKISETICACQSRPMSKLSQISRFYQEMRAVAPILTYGIPPTFGGLTYVRIVDIDHMLALEVDICQYLQFDAHFWSAQKGDLAAYSITGRHCGRINAPTTSRKSCLMSRCSCVIWFLVKISMRKNSQNRHAVYVTEDHYCTSDGLLDEQSRMPSPRWASLRHLSERFFGSLPIVSSIPS
jgi:hypothetical protein